MGTPAFAVPSLARLLDDGHELAAVYSKPPRPAGRGMSVKASPVAALAHQRGLLVRTPTSLKGAEEQAAFAALVPDAAILVAYGLILPRPILDAPRLGSYNVHASLLPRWRGAAPIARAIMAGDRETGVSIMRVTEGLDAGPVCLVEKVEVAPGTTAGDLHDRLAVLGGDLMSRALADLDAGRLNCTPQPQDGVTYAQKLDKSETKLDFYRPSSDVLNHIHGLSPYPGAWFKLPAGERVKVLRADPAEGKGAPGLTMDDGLTVGCGDGAVRLLVLQREGKAAMESEAFLRGLPVPRGTRLA